MAFLIGVGCRLVEVRLPAPTALLGAVIVLAITLGYLSANRLLATKHETGKPDGLDS